MSHRTQREPPRGSLMHVLDWTEQATFAVDLLRLVQPVRCTVDANARWMPQGQAHPAEARLETFGPQAFPDKPTSIWQALHDWWLVNGAVGQTCIAVRRSYRRNCAKLAGFTSLLKALLSSTILRYYNSPALGYCASTVNVARITCTASAGRGRYCRGQRVRALGPTDVAVRMATRIRAPFDVLAGKITAHPAARTRESRDKLWDKTWPSRRYSGSGHRQASVYVVGPLQWSCTV